MYIWGQTPFRGKDMEKEKKDKLSFAKTIANDIYALKLGMKFSKKAVLNAAIAPLLWFSGWVFFDGIYMKRIVADLEAGKSFNEIFYFLAVVAVVFFFGNLYDAYVEEVVMPIEGIKIYRGIYSLLYKKAKNVELRCYEDPDFYSKYTMAMDTADVKILEIVRCIFGMIFGTIGVSIVFVMMYRIDKFAVLFILCPLTGYFFFGNIENKLNFKMYELRAKHEKVLNYVNRMMYLPDGAKEIRLYNIFNILKKQYKDATKQNVKIAEDLGFKIAATSFAKIMLSFTIIFEGVLFYAIYRFSVSKTITLPDLTVMTSLMVAMTWMLIRVFENIMVIMKNGMFVNNFRSFLEYKETIPEDQDGIIPDTDFKTLEFRNVTFSYKDEETIKNLSFTIENGHTAALVGHNGAGKTTIIKLMLRFYDPTEGEILYNGINIKDYNLRAYRELFATTFQDFQLFGMSIKDNVLMGRHYDNEDELVTDALKKTGVYDKVATIPGGIEAIMTKEFEDDGVVLSGGESQKIAVARTFVKEAPMKIFDEPSSALDPIAEFELFKNIMNEGQDRTMLFISHRLSSVKACDKVLMLERGRLIEEGTHSELMKENGKYAEMYKRQAMNYLAIENEEEVVF